MIIKFLSAAVLAGTPLLFGTLGEITNQKAGHINLGVEGMMAMGACAGFMTAYVTDNFLLSLLAAFAAGALGALIYAVLTVTFMASQNVTGLTLTIFGVGLSNFFGIHMISLSENGTLKLPELVTAQMRGVSIPALENIPMAGELLFSYNPFVYLGVAMAIALYLYFNHTKAGLNIRAVGENPAAADAAGIKVIKLKYLNLLLGGGICGIGGAYCSMIINNGVWISDSVGGLGWISVALVIFATWSPLKAVMGAFVFGIFRILRFYMPRGVIVIPEAFYDMLPFLVTSIVLVAASVQQSREKSQPQSCGTNYFREER